VITMLLILGTTILTTASPHHKLNRLRLNSRRHFLARELRVGAIHFDDLAKRDETCCPGMFQTFERFPALYSFWAPTLTCPQVEIATMVQTTSAVKIVREGLVVMDRRVGFAVLMLCVVATLLALAS